MKDSTLLFRSLAAIIFITGIAHLASYASQKDDINYSYDESIDSNQKKIFPEEEKTKSNNNPDTDYIVGKWKVNYNVEDFNGAIFYNIKKEGEYFNAYTYEYQDKNGNSEKAIGLKTLVIKSFDGYQGKGVYSIEYEHQQYQVDCQIDMVDKNAFKLSYDYYGYSDVETWQRQ
ncbi:hypothetical protein [Winogradskyella haliclonae]|uniref:DUF4488 domain-containing protein n=1 Tax=Winogradskyella haliclonae TaxID=2048558 RepID=A0ABQ2BZN8_9FLAO|nr:hypothetical protein [Winogradskyella haliclonae]GGI57746.1 hypothetical protein GCM10011444_20550 [Winogradskyella haliclonae]